MAGLAGATFAAGLALAFVAGEDSPLGAAFSAALVFAVAGADFGSALGLWFGSCFCCSYFMRFLGIIVEKNKYF